MGYTEKSQRDDNDCGWNGDQERESTCVFGTKVIQSAYSEDRCSCKKLGMVYAQVLEGGQGADRRGNNVVSDQEKGSDDRQDLGTMPDASVNAVPVRIVGRWSFRDGGLRLREGQRMAGERVAWVSELS
jgi:hypothetical protein